MSVQVAVAVTGDAVVPAPIRQMARKVRFFS
jgi:hypothetical protein